jgi:YidC/Oxa1 family membrane protein insertase
MKALYTAILYKPLLNVLIVLYSYVTFRDLGVAVVLLTLIVRFALWPLFHKTTRSQIVMQKIQPEIKRIQKEQKQNRVRQSELLMELYRKHNINPLSGFGLLLIQIPVIIALYQVFLSGFKDVSASLYSFVPAVSSMNHLFLGLVDLTQPSIVLTVAAAVAQFVQGKTAGTPTKNEAPRDPNEAPDTAALISKQMMFIAPVITLVVLWKLPAVVGIYWLTTTVFSIFQQAIVHAHLRSEAAR